MFTKNYQHAFKGVQMVQRPLILSFNWPITIGKFMPGWFGGGKLLQNFQIWLKYWADSVQNSPRETPKIRSKLRVGLFWNRIKMSSGPQKSWYTSYTTLYVIKISRIEYNNYISSKSMFPMLLFQKAEKVSIHGEICQHIGRNLRDVKTKEDRHQTQSLERCEMYSFVFYSWGRQGSSM